MNESVHSKALQIVSICGQCGGLFRNPLPIEQKKKVEWKIDSQFPA
jgi:hypothetical protein